VVFDRAAADKAVMDSGRRHRMPVLALLGTGVGVAFFDYSYVSDPRTSAEKVAQAFKDALPGTTVTAQGELTLKPGQEVALADGATVDLERNAKVGLESGATVRLDASATDGRGLPAPQAVASSMRRTEAQMNMGPGKPTSSGTLQSSARLRSGRARS
jgi:hypothetical protein